MRNILVLLTALSFAGHAYAQSAANTESAPPTVAAVTFKMFPPKQCIKADPSPCVLEEGVELIPCGNSRFVSFSATTTVTYKDNGRNDSTTSSESWSGSACKVLVHENMDGRIVGGNVIVVVTAKRSDGTIDTGSESGVILGTNPLSADVRTVIGNPTYSVVTYDRSKFRQFAADGRPLFDKGFGVMRLKSPDAEQVWNWKRNIEAGKFQLDAAWAGAKTYPAKMRSAGFPKLKDFTVAELKLFALQSLVGEFYYVPNKRGRAWVPNDKRSDYADRLQKLEVEVAAGKTPADW